MSVRWKDKSDIGTLAAGDRFPVTDVSDSNIDKYATPAEIASYVNTSIGVINVTDPAYGVHGNGVNSDSAGFQLAVDAAAASSTTKIVYAPNRDLGYVFDATVTIPSGVVIVGDNRRGLQLSRIKPAAAFSAPFFESDDYGVSRVLRIGIIGLYLDGSSTTLTAIQANCQESVFRDLTIKNCFTYGLHIGGISSAADKQALNNHITENYLAGTIGSTEFFDGIFLDYFTADSTTERNYVEASKDAGIRSRGYNNKITNNHIYSVAGTGGGVGAGIYTETSADHDISQNYIELCAKQGVLMAGGGSDVATLAAAVHGNVFRNINTGGTGSGVIEISGSDVSAVAISGNAVRRDAATTYTTPYFVYFNGITPTLQSVIGNQWQSGLVTTAESNLVNLPSLTTPLIQGGLNSGDDLRLTSTAHATKGTINFGNATTGMFFNESQERLSLGADDQNITIAGNSTGVDLTIHNDEAGEVCQCVIRYASSATRAACWFGARARGNIGAKTVVQSGDRLVNFEALGFDGTDFEIAGQIVCEVDGAPGNNDMPGRWIFLVTPDGSTTPAEAMRISQDKDVLIAATLTVPNTGLHLLDTNASHDLIIKPGSDITADRTLTLTTGDANRTLTLSGDATLNQAVDTGASPTFVNESLTGYLELSEIASPANPAANVLRLFAKDVAGVTKAYIRDSAGGETDLGSGGSGSTVDFQSFTASGTWTKPSMSANSMVLVRGWGQGGGGGRGGAGDGGGGGGGGGYSQSWFLLSQLGATETVTIGNAANGATADNTDGTVGSNSTFGTHLTALGGGGGGGAGANLSGGGGGGSDIWGGFASATPVGASVGAVGAASGGAGGTSPVSAGGASAIADYFGGAGGANVGSAVAGAASVFGGGGGGGGTTTNSESAGGTSRYGGGGGGGGSDTGTGKAGGTSTYGGAGGAGNTGAAAGTAGTQPGGGGGGSESANAGNGGAGRIDVYVFGV